MGSRKIEMKVHVHDRAGGPVRGRFRTILAGFAAFLLAAIPALATDEGSDPPPDGGPLSAGGDETIGTLPIVGVPRINLPFTRGWRGIEPSFFLEGSAEDLSIAILSARGRGFISHETIDSQSGRIRLAFHGDVLVTLDREFATSSPIEFGVAVPAAFGEGRIAVAWGKGPIRTAPLRPRILPLPVASMSASGALDQAPIRIRTGNSAGVRTSQTVSATADLIILGQAQ